MKINSLILKMLKNQNIRYVDVGAANNLDLRCVRSSKFLNYVRFEPDQRSIKYNLFIDRVLKLLFGKNYKSHLTY